MTSLSRISSLLSEATVGPVIDPALVESKILIDLSASNSAIQKVDLQDTIEFTSYIFNLLKETGATIGYGGYGENRIIYERSDHFHGEERRSLHLGVDLWTEPGVAVFSPLDAVVHSLADNQGLGNYGPTIILRHKLEEVFFYSLYGHLSRSSLKTIKQGQSIQKGDKIGEIGTYLENGDWPPHLHFQLITDLLGWEGDFPGVARPSEKDKYLSICPDPNLILRIA